MKIAFITYEYPPDTAFGGIATYVQQAANMLHKRGHYIEVFSGSHYKTFSDNSEGFWVHRIKELNIWNFSKQAGSVFAQRHSEVHFDVLEGPEYAADANEAVHLVPDIPLVVKLHTPSILLFKLNYSNSVHNSFIMNVRFFFNALRKGIRPEWGYDAPYLNFREQTKKINKIERLHALDADEIASPSVDLGKLLVNEWGLNPEIISPVPYPYQSDERLLDIPINMNSNTITFLGRLEARKGVLDLAEAIPYVLQHYPEARFRFVGQTDISPDPHMNMDTFLKQKLHSYKNAVEFVGPVQLDKIPEILCTTDICVFPSLWENFPLVCLESMAAGRAIVASNAGGMKDMLDDGRAGILLTPGNPNNIAKNIITLLKDKELRIKLGHAARNRLLAEYNTTKIGAIQENSYARAIKRRQAKGVRHFNGH